MARRRWKRIKPDMGWYVSPFLFTHLAEGLGAGTQVTELMAFSEIDGDEGIIAKDKSDWFIKRMIVDCFYELQPNDSDNPNDTYRVFPWMFATMGADSATEMAANNYPVNEPDGYDAVRRVIRTGTSPAYVLHAWKVELNVGDNFGATEVAFPDGVSVGGFKAHAPYWGESKISFDIPVSNAGLVPDSSLYFMTTFGTDQGPGQYDWTSGDQVHFYMNLKVLLQKRIG